MANTEPLVYNKTESMAGINIEERIILFDDIIFEGEKDSYNILASECIGFGGESQVYKARRVSDGQDFVAKIYDQFQDTKLNRANRDRVIDFIISNSDYTKSHILPLVDYGRVTVKSEDGEDYRLPVDILPVCASNEFKKLDYKTIKEKVIPGVLYALNLMHNAELVHRDIKPANINFLNGEVVVADFGTACRIDGQMYYGTTLRRGTLGYTAPEVWQGYAVKESDYFSFGCTIASLYNGEHVYQRLVDMKDAGAINKAINSNGLPLNCPNEEKDLQILVDALTTMDEAKRAGYEDVLLWLRDSSEFERKNRIEFHPEQASLFEFHFENTVCRTERELVEVLNANWEKAKGYLYRGGIKNSMIINFFSKINQSLGYKIGELIEEGDTATNYDLGLAKTLHYIADGGALMWNGKKYNRLADIATAISEDNVSVDEIATMLSSGYLSWKLEQGKNPDGDTIKAVKDVESVAKEYPKLAYFYAKYSFTSEVSNNTYQGVKTIDEVFEMLTNSTSKFYEGNKTILEDDELLAFIASHGFKDGVMLYKQNYSGKPLGDLELLYRLFENAVNDKVKVRKHYIEYGPSSYLYWFQSNLSLYDYGNKQAEKTRDNIKSVVLQPSMTIDELASSFITINEYKKNFVSMFQGNILLTYFGLSDDSKSITSSNSDAYFVEDFFGMVVPSGYMRYIKDK